MGIILSVRYMKRTNEEVMLRNVKYTNRVLAINDRCKVRKKTTKKNYNIKAFKTVGVITLTYIKHSLK